MNINNIKVSVIGDGGWGTAISILLCSKGINTVLWSVSSEYSQYLEENRENIKFLKGVSLPDNLQITNDVSLLDNSDFVFFVVPCEYLHLVLDKFKDVNFKHIISATKGIENGSLKRPSEIIQEYFSNNLISVLSGPSISFEVANAIPTTVVLASKNNISKEIQELLTTKTFRTYTSEDVIGVELGGALKNVIAIASGISDGLGFGTNTKAAILTRGLAEITRLGVKMGAKKSTFSGLSGIGDMATTCISKQSRNRWFGEQIGKGQTKESVMKDIEMVVEGVLTCKSAYQLSKKYDVDMPIVEKVYEVLYENKSPGLAVEELMTRDLKEEDY